MNDLTEIYKKEAKRHTQKYIEALEADPTTIPQLLKDIDNSKNIDERGNKYILVRSVDLAEALGQDFIEIEPLELGLETSLALLPHGIFLSKRIAYDTIDPKTGKYYLVFKLRRVKQDDYSTYANNTTDENNIFGIALPKKEQFGNSDSITIRLDEDITRINKEDPLYAKIFKIVRNFRESFHDYSSLCLYYAYYNLNLKGNADFLYEFGALENRLYDDFYYYVIYSIISELEKVYYDYDNSYGKLERERNLCLFNFINVGFNKHQIEITFKKDYDKFVSAMSDYMRMDKKIIYSLIEIVFLGTLGESDLGICSTDYISSLYFAEKYCGYITKPRVLFNLAINVFKKDFPYDFEPHFSDVKVQSWISMAKVMLNRDLISKTAFVDTCWSLQHNNGTLIDNLLDPHIENTEYCLQALDKLNQYLSDIRNEDFTRVYECAKKYNPKLDRFLYKSLIVGEDITDSLTRYLIALPTDDKFIIYEAMSKEFGIENIKINELTQNKDNFIIDVINKDKPGIRYITDMNSFLTYIFEKYPNKEIEDFYY